MDSKKKLVLTSETLVNLSMKSGIKTGIGGGNSVVGPLCAVPSHGKHNCQTLTQ